MLFNDVQALPDEKKEGDDKINTPYYGLVGVVRDRYDRAKRAKRTTEERQLRAWRNFRGIYGPDVAFRENEKSRVFVKITKTKTLAAFGQILEVLFATNKFPISIKPTEKPDGIAEYAHIDPAKAGQEEAAPPPDPYGFLGDGQTIMPGSTYADLLGGLEKKYGDAGFVEGPAPDPTKMVQISPAEEAAKNMEKVIHDQLEESSAGTVFRQALLELAMLGHCIIKGPFSYEKTVHKWMTGEKGNSYAPYNKLVPKLEWVSVWNFYPDPDGRTIEDAEWVVERHALSRSALRDLTNRPYFRAEAIRATIEDGTNYIREWYEDFLEDNASETNQKDRYEVLEYWGVMDKALAEDAGLDIPESMDDLEQVQVNVWVCANRVLRLVLNPFVPARIPYHSCPYEHTAYQFFGVGVPENMEDCQLLMNGHIRMAIDNLAFAGHLIFDIDEQALVPGQEFKIYPGKIFRRNTGYQGQAVNGLKFPNTAPENLMMFDKARQLADESTGIPSYSHGSQGAQAMTRTASGMSMLMGAAALNIKTVVKNIDDYLLRPLGEAFFFWNMQFNEEAPEIRGDLEIKARGTSALMQKEVRSQRLLTLLQVAAHPQYAPFIRAHVVFKQIAESLDLEPDQVVNDPEQAAIYARIMGMINGQGLSEETSAVGSVANMGTSGGAGSEGSSTDPTGAGNGNIGTGVAPRPGETGFSSSDTRAQGANA